MSAEPLGAKIKGENREVIEVIQELITDYDPIKSAFLRELTWSCEREKLSWGTF